MTDRPIIFNAAMIRAILEGRKTQTRRVLKPQPTEHRPNSWDWKGPQSAFFNVSEVGVSSALMAHLVKFTPGDRLWVREAWAKTPVAPIVETIDNPMTVYRTGDNRTDYGGPWKPSIHMFRRDSRITLHVTDVRVERVMDISEEDARVEGVCAWVEQSDHIPWGSIEEADRAGIVRATYGSEVIAFSALWNSINEPRGFSWDANPWVVAVTFEPEFCNIDQARAA